MEAGITLRLQRSGGRMEWDEDGWGGGGNYVFCRPPSDSMQHELYLKVDHSHIYSYREHEKSPRKSHKEPYHTRNRVNTS